MEPIPKILYKYRLLSGDSFKFTHDIFIKDELYFAHPDDFNDPFDCKILPYLEKLDKKQLIKKIRAINPKKFESKESGLNECIINVENTPITVIRQKLKRELKSHQNVGIFSLSENYLDILMWGHYADSHRGICIGFDCNGLSFTFNYKGKSTPISPEQVKYPPDNKYPQWDPFKDDVLTQIDKVYLTKAKNWEYEKEWRVILPEQARTLQKIKPSTLVSVHLGCQISKGDKETVINWCSQRELKPQLYEMTKSDSSYSLKENKILY